jgi:hypothetical protein
MYLQIYTSNYVCQTFSSTPKTIIFLTPDKQHLKTSGETKDCFVSQRKYIDVIKIFEINSQKIIQVFHHTSDKVLDAYIRKRRLVIVGDNEKVLYEDDIDYDRDVERDGLIVYATKNYLMENNLPYF